VPPNTTENPLAGAEFADAAEASPVELAPALTSTVFLCSFSTGTSVLKSFTTLCGSPKIFMSADDAVGGLAFVMRHCALTPEMLSWLLVVLVNTAGCALCGFDVSVNVKFSIFWEKLDWPWNVDVVDGGDGALLMVMSGSAI